MGLWYSQTVGLSNPAVGTKFQITAMLIVGMIAHAVHRLPGGNNAATVLAIEVLMNHVCCISHRNGCAPHKLPTRPAPNLEVVKEQRHECLCVLRLLSASL